MRVFGFVLAIAGAVLAFALQPDQRPNWTALGLVILVTGLAILLVLGLMHLSSAAGNLFPRTPANDNRSGSEPPQGDRSFGGLLAVVSGLLAVVILGVVTLALLQDNDTDQTSTVAIATSAFGVISAVVGAYLGVKIGAEQTQQATKTAGEATDKAQETAREATKTADKAQETAREATRTARATEGRTWLRR